MLRDHDPMAGHGGGARRPPCGGRGQPRTGLDSGWLGPHGGSAPVGANARHGVRRTVAPFLRVAKAGILSIENCSYTRQSREREPTGRLNMTTVTISLPETLRTFIDEQLATKGYGNVSEYFRSLLRGRKST